MVNPKITSLKWRVTSACVWSFSCGFSDATPGALLPFMEEYYHISYSVVSLIWMANAVGFILVAALAHKIQQWFGMRKSITLGCMLSVVMCAMVSSGAHFALTVAGFFFGGVGLSICLAQTNIYLARLEKSSTYLAYCHGAYGLGATVSPLIGTAAVNHGFRWNFFYLLLMGQMLVHSVNLWYSFEGIEEEERLKEENHENERALQERILSGEENTGSVELQELGATPSNNEIHITGTGVGRSVEATGSTTAAAATNEVMISALKNKLTWLMALFILFYQGSEVSMAGWIVTYLLDYRHGDKTSVGYVASGFWGGLTIGRLCLTDVIYKKIGARRGVLLLGIAAIVLVIVVWVVPSAVAAGILVAFAGIMIGPNYTLLITMTTRILPRKIQVISLTIMTAFGSSGGAIFPFMVGLISQYSGTYVVLPIFIALYSSMIIVWLCLPNVEREGKTTKAVGWRRLMSRIW